MKTQQYLRQLDALELTLRKLSQRYTELQQHLDGMRLENRRLHQVIEEKEEELKNFQNQDNITKIVGSIAADAGNTTELKWKINEYIREIDKCIAHLKH